MKEETNKVKNDEMNEWKWSYIKQRNKRRNEGIHEPINIPWYQVKNEEMNENGLTLDKGSGLLESLLLSYLE